MAGEGGVGPGDKKKWGVEDEKKKEKKEKKVKKVKRGMREVNPERGRNLSYACDRQRQVCCKGDE